MFDWEGATRYAAQNTRLRVGDLLLAPAGVVAQVTPKAEVSVDVAELGELSFSVEAA